MGDEASSLAAAKSALAAGNNKEALAHVKEALKSDPKSYDALL